jgi:exopolysaccharide biosynthesis polyprenyl glycosylphosphotransferase
MSQKVGMRSSLAARAGSRDEAAIGYQWLRRPRRLLALLDGLAAIASSLFLFAMIEWRPMPENAAHTAQIGTALVLLITMVLGFRNGQYTNSRRLSRISDAGRFFVHMLAAVCVVALLAILTKGFFFGALDFSRLDVASSLCLFLVLATVSRLVLAVRQRAMFMQGVAFRKVLVIGSGRAAGDFIRFLAKRPWLGVACVGTLEYRQADDPAFEDGQPDVPHCIAASYKGFENLDRVWVASGASEVVVALDPEDSALLPEITELLSLAHVSFRMVPSLFEETFQSTELMGYAELPVIDVDVDPLDRVERTFKRALDLSVSSVAMLVGCVPALVLVLAIKLDSRGPVFYKQERIGRNGRRFFMYKFRTMVVDADKLVEQLDGLNEHAGNGELFKIKNDPRVTRVGRFLRKWSLDELPQILNVYKGEMSWVGPRPPLPREVENYESKHYARLKGLPGITGLWQVSGRSDLSFEEMVKLDRYYLDNWSIRLDIGIMMRTVAAVLTRNGAY